MTSTQDTQRCNAWVPKHGWVEQCGRDAAGELGVLSFCRQHLKSIRDKATDEVSAEQVGEQFRFDPERMKPPEPIGPPPPPTTLYRMYDKDGCLLYAGISSRGPRRFREHREEKHWWRQVATINVEHFDVSGRAIEAEKKAIEEEKPRFNVVHSLTPKQKRPRSFTRRLAELEAAS